MDRQMSAPAGTGRYQKNQQKTSKMGKVGRSVKNSVADFFGLGDEDSAQASKWQNRHMRYYRGKVKDSALTNTTDFDEIDSSSIPHIIDPLARSGRYSSRRTTPLSSTSTYTASTRGFPKQRTRKDSVLKMTWKGMQTITGTRKKLRTHNRASMRSYAPASLAGDIADGRSELGDSYPPMHDDLVDDVFYDEPTAGYVEKPLEKIREETSADLSESANMMPAPGWRRGAQPQPAPGTPGTGLDMPDFGMRRIGRDVLNSVRERDRRNVGMGFVGRLFERNYRPDRMNSEVKKQIDELDDHRPFFTYWVTFVQIVVFIVSVAVYGIAPIGSSETVYTQSADLIHLGAKYSPCMRMDQGIQKGLDKDLEQERNSACCIRDDGSGCYQSVESTCSKTLNTWDKWSESNPGHGRWTSGSVCGQDPQYCKKPSSSPPFEWENDITQWPLCTDTSKPNTTGKDDRHMTCTISGRPCCHGIQGECMITTREHCDYVPCMKQICGMIPFAQDKYPDQFYRLWTSLFLHGGLFHLVITLGFQILIMRDMEKLTGSIRMTIIYVGSGIAGNLASCIFVPYHVEVGPAGSQFGILACLLVEVLQSWQMLQRPAISLLKVAVPIVVLFLLGLLPWIDNWAHVCGFLFGFLLAFSLLPYVSFGQFDRRRKLIGIILSLGGAILLFVLLVILFYVLPLYDCPGCQYFNCVPFTPNFCKNMEVNIDRNATYSSALSE
ncbi:RHDF1-like protein [Mya arenaria]|uniref:RHDF1-like protein n=1 Tax=Mya arenaria TaxID=6604 RepID=A0ABY7DHB2_MYAAR|nr:RHDF1-like protein [Mya arenaria]